MIISKFTFRNECKIGGHINLIFLPKMSCKGLAPNLQMAHRACIGLGRANIYLIVKGARAFWPPGATIWSSCLIWWPLGPWASNPCRMKKFILHDPHIYRRQGTEGDRSGSTGSCSISMGLDSTETLTWIEGNGTSQGTTSRIGIGSTRSFIMTGKYGKCVGSCIWPIGSLTWNRNPY